jgi:hypothetical protein
VYSREEELHQIITKVGTIHPYIYIHINMDQLNSAFSGSSMYIMQLKQSSQRQFLYM